MQSKLKYGIYSGVSVLMAVVILAFVLMISHQNHHRFDITTEQRFSLSPQSVTVMQGIKEPVEAIAFVKDKDLNNRKKCEELLSMYKACNSKLFSYRIVDPVLQPLEAKKYNVRMPGSIVVVSGKKNGLATTPSEQDMTNALVGLSKIVNKKVYFTTGHGEWGGQEDQQKGSSTSQMRQALASEGFIGASLSISSTNAIPDDAVALVIAGPKTAMLPKEQQILSSWLEKGGRAFLLLSLESGSSYDWLLKKYAIDCPRELVIDINSQMQGATPIFVVCNKYDASSSITEGFSLETCFKMARPVMPLASKPKNSTVDGFVFSQDNTFSIGEAVLSSGSGQISEADAAHRGSMPMMVAGIYSPADKADVTKDKTGSSVSKRDGTRLVVSGSVDFAGDELFGVGGNRDLVLNILNWLAGSEEHITIRPKTQKVEPIMVSGRTLMVIKVLLIFAIPLAVFLTGLTCARKRRQ